MSSCGCPVRTAAVIPPTTTTNRTTRCGPCSRGTCATPTTTTTNPNDNWNRNFVPPALLQETAGYVQRVFNMSLSSNLDEIIGPHVGRLLSTRQHPNTFCPSEVARALRPEELRAAGVTSWRDLMPAVREHIWVLRGQNQVEVLQKRQVILGDISLDEVKGPIRVRQRRNPT